MGETARLSYTVCTIWVVCTLLLCLAFLLQHISQPLPCWKTNVCIGWNSGQGTVCIGINYRNQVHKLVLLEN